MKGASARCVVTPTDEQLRVGVVIELTRDPRVGGDPIQVSVRAGVVTLTGRVDDWTRRYAAQRAATRVPGVVDVTNEVEVRTATARRSDTEIAAAVRWALTWDKALPDECIRSTVSDGDVRLEGEVDGWSQREAAEDAVRNLPGVRSVDNQLTAAAPTTGPVEVHAALSTVLETGARRRAEGFEVVVDDGHVTLSGAVRTPAEREQLLQAVRAMPGVRSVADRLNIDPQA